MPESNVLLDNSAFAGVMRCLQPELEKHEQFLREYPGHNDVDVRSFKEFLTAICLFDRLLLDSVSQVVSISESVEHPAAVNLASGPASWVERMRGHLAPELARIVRPLIYAGGTTVLDHKGACETAYDLFCSKLSPTIRLRADEKLPNVYSTGAYVFRDEFEQINRERGNLLTPELLSQAMFLHRGLFLQSRALQSGITYWPYLYRGRMLAGASPLVSEIPPSDGLVAPSVGQALGVRPSEHNIVRQLNEFYYQLMDEIRWLPYDEGIPFIGESIYAISRGDPSMAVEKAIEFRSRSDIRQQWNELRAAVDSNDKAHFNRRLKTIQRDFTAAAAHLGLGTESPQTKSLLKLAASIVPRGMVNAIAAAISFLPDRAQEWGKDQANRLLTKNSFQLLFIGHARVLQS